MRNYAILGVLALVVLLGLSSLNVPAAEEEASPVAAPADTEQVTTQAPDTSGTRAPIYTKYVNQTFNIGSGWDWTQLTAVVWVQSTTYKQQSNPSFRSAEVVNAHAEEFSGAKTTTGQTRTVLAELATGTWCGYCPGADGAFHRLRQDAAWYPDKVVLIEWHNGDVYANNDHNSRIGSSGYNTGGFPTAYFDGVLASVGGASSPNTTSIDNTYKNMINTRSPKATELEIETFGTISASGGWVNASIIAHSEPSVTSLQIFIAIVETGLSYTHGSDQVPLSNTGRNIISKVPFSIPNDPPTIALGDDFGGQTLNGEVEITWTASDPEDDDSTLPISISYSDNGGVSFIPIATNEANDGSYMWDVSTLADTDNGRLKVMTTDSRGESVADIGTGIFIIDNPTAPVVDLTAPEDGKTYSSETVITWTASDDEDGSTVSVDLYWSDASEVWQTIATGEANDGTYTWDISALDDGQYKVKIEVEDSDSMTAFDQSYAFFKVDNPEPPTAEVTYPTAGVWLSGVKEITWTSEDPEDNAAEMRADVELSIDGGSTWEFLAEDIENEGTYALDTTTIPDGNGYKVRVTVTDTDGMSVVTESGAFSVYNPDSPEITTTAFDTATWTGEYEVTWTATDADVGETLTVDFLYSVDGSIWTPIAETETNDGSYLFDTLTLEDGAYYFKLVVTDDSDSQLQDTVKSSERIVIYNPDAPTIVMDKPLGGAVLSGWAEVAWSADDEDGDDVTVAFEYSTDGITWTTVESGLDDNEVYRWDTTTLTDGLYYLRVVGTDDSPEALSAEYVLGESVRIDNPDAPGITLLYPEGGETVSGKMTVEWTSDDADAKDTLVVEVYYKKTGGQKKSITKNGDADGDLEWDTATVPNGDYRIMVVVKDQTGLTGSAESGEFTVQNEVVPSGDGQDITGGGSSDKEGSDEGDDLMLYGIIAAVVAAIVVALVLLMFMKKKKQPEPQQPMPGYPPMQPGMQPAPAPAPQYGGDMYSDPYGAWGQPPAQDPYAGGLPPEQGAMAAAPMGGPETQLTPPPGEAPQLLPPGPQ